MNADIGTWDGAPETPGCTFFYADIDVSSGGGSLTFTYNQRKQYVPVNDWLDVYILIPGTTWDPGDVWNESGSIRCFRQDYPSGVVPVIEDFLWQYAPGETADYFFDMRLDEWQGERIRVVFRQWFDGYPGDHTQTRIRDLKFNPTRFEIDTPTSGAQFPLSQHNYRETVPIQFRVRSDAQASSATWTADLECQTSRNKGAVTQQDTFTTEVNAAATRSDLARGGQIGVRATATVNGTSLSTGLVKFYVVGVAIPDPDITARLTSLYATGEKVVVRSTAALGFEGPLLGQPDQISPLPGAVGQTRNEQPFFDDKGVWGTASLSKQHNARS